MPVCGRARVAHHVCLASGVGGSATYLPTGGGMPLLGRPRRWRPGFRLLVLACAPAGGAGRKDRWPAAPAVDLRLARTPLAPLGQPTSVPPTAPTAVRARCAPGLAGCRAVPGCRARLFPAARARRYPRADPQRAPTSWRRWAPVRLTRPGGGLNPGPFNALQRGVAMRIVADKGTLRRVSGTSRSMVRRDLLDSGPLRRLPGRRGLKVALNNLASIEAFHPRAGVGTRRGFWQDDAWRLVQLSLSPTSSPPSATAA